MPLLLVVVSLLALAATELAVDALSGVFVQGPAADLLLAGALVAVGACALFTLYPLSRPRTAPRWAWGPSALVPSLLGLAVATRLDPGPAAAAVSGLALDLLRNATLAVPVMALVVLVASGQDPRRLPRAALDLWPVYGWLCALVLLGGQVVLPGVLVTYVAAFAPVAAVRAPERSVFVAAAHALARAPRRAALYAFGGVLLGWAGAIAIIVAIDGTEVLMQLMVDPTATSPLAGALSSGAALAAEALALAALTRAWEPPPAPVATSEFSASEARANPFASG